MSVQVTHEVLGMRNVTVACAASLILAGCGGGGESPAPSAPTVTAASSPTIAKDPLKIITGTSYDAGDGGLNPRWVIGDFDKDGLKDIFLRYDPESAFSTTTTGTSPVRFFLGKSNGGLEQSTAIFPEGFSPTLVNRIIINDFNGDGGQDIMIATAGQDPYSNNQAVQSGHTSANATILNYSPNGYTIAKVANNPSAWIHHSSAGDIDGDYLPDVFVDSLVFSDPFFIMGNNSQYRADTTRFEKNTFNFQKTILERFNDTSPKKWESTAYSSSAMIDANGDGRMDLALMSGGNTKTSVVYLNDGSGHFSDYRKMELPAGPNGTGYAYYQNQSDTKFISVGTIHLDTVVADVNGDGKQDIISLTTYADQNPSDYVYYRGAAIQILINNGNGFTDETKTRSNFSHVTTKNYTHYDSLEYVDVNNDKCKDILLHRGQINYNDNANPTRILINDCKGNFTEKAYPKSLPNGILTVLGDGHYAILVNTMTTQSKYTQRVDDVYYDWSLGQNLFP